MIENSINKLLHQRIIDSCEKIFNDGHYESAAFKSMKEVEIALREKGNFDNKLFGSHLIKKAFGNGDNVRLKVPFLGVTQRTARAYFKGVFQYYRNYLAHDGRDITEEICLKIFVIASELISLIGSSRINMTNMDSINSVIVKYGFENETRFSDLLQLLSNQKFPYETFDGMFEDLANSGFSDEQYEIVFELELVEYKSKEFNHSMSDDDPDWDTFGWLELTDQGNGVLKKLKK